MMVYDNKMKYYLSYNSKVRLKNGSCGSCEIF